MRAQKIRTDMGFTLPEVIVAITLLLLIAVAFGPMISHAFTEIFLAGEKTKTIHEAETRVHELRQKEDDDPDDKSGFPEVRFGTDDPRNIESTGKQASIKSTWSRGMTSITIYLPPE